MFEAWSLQVHAAGLEDEGGQDHDEVEQPTGHGALHEVQPVAAQRVADQPAAQESLEIHLRRGLEGVPWSARWRGSLWRIPWSVGL